MLKTEKEWYIEAPWGRICVLAWGDCLQPPVLLCHGGQDSAASWRPIVDRLPDKFYYIGMEVPGNGKSDPLPKGLMLSIHDLVYSVEVVRRHFRWEQFIFMAHSLGTLMGKIYNLSYPGRMSRVVDFDPTPAYEPVEPDEFAAWYHQSFTNYFKKYHIYNASRDTAPKYTKEKALSMLHARRGLSRPTAEMVLERISEPIGDGLVRFTYDQRSKAVVRLPFSTAHLKKIYTNIKTPTLTLAASESVNRGRYSKTPFALDETAYPDGNYRVVNVIGSHDVHVEFPERCADFVALFLLYGLDGLDRKAKL